MLHPKLASITTGIIFVVVVAMGTTSFAGPTGPKYHNLRFNDDYSYLDNSANRGNDFFDSFKRMPVGSSSSFSIGGQYRFRFESDDNRKLGASTPTSQSVYLNRIFLFGDLQIGDKFRIFTEAKWAGISNNDLPAPAIAHDNPDIENLFADYWFSKSSASSFGLRVGRQELQFGKQRLISPLDWANTRRTFDGAQFMSNFGDWSLNAFVTRPVVVDPDDFNEMDDTRAFSGIYASRTANSKTLSGYFLVLTKDAPPSLIAGLTSDYEYFTLGAGYDGKVNNIDWSTEGAYQFGSLGTNNIASYMLSLNGGYTFGESKIKPRFGLSYDIASGDDDLTDSDSKTFNQHFPLGHAYFGWADQVGRQNITSISAQLSAKPSKKFVTKLNWFKFNLAQETDALYNPGGGVSRLDITGVAGNDVGSEIDALIIYNLNVHASIHFGYASFTPGDFIKNTGTSESHNLFYVMLPVKF